MKDKGKTKAQLIKEMAEMHLRIRELEKSETERLGAEEALRLSMERLQLALDAANSGTWEWDLRTNENIWSKELWKLYGLEPHRCEPSYEAWRQTIHPYDRAKTEQVVLEAAQKGTELNAEWRVLLPDGEERWLMSRGRPLLDANGQAERFIGVVIDISERKRAELREKLDREVLELLNRPEGFAGSVHDILQMIKMNTGFEAVGIRLRERGDFPYYEADGFSEDFIQAERYLCARDEEGKIIRDGQGNPVPECMCGNILCNRINPALPFFTEGGSFWTNSTTDLLASTTEMDRQARTRNRCNAEGYESVALIPLRSGDEIIGLLQLNDRRRNQFTPEMIQFFEGLGASIGIALSRRQAETELEKRTVQLEEANKELESFSYSVAHDLRAPLRAIDGYARMILKKQGDKFDKDTLDKFKIIRSNALLMGQLIDDLLALSRLGRKHMSLTLLDIDTLIRDVWKEMQSMNPDRDMVLTVNSIPPGYGDRVLIKQVCINLLSNAVKFTKNRDTAHIEAGGYSDGNEVVYYIRDNGVGFDMEYYDKLFGVFQRLHSADAFEGTGVGLAIVQRIVHRHGGRVWAEGKVDKGACFYFALSKQEESVK